MLWHDSPIRTCYTLKTLHSHPVETALVSNSWTLIQTSHLVVSLLPTVLSGTTISWQACEIQSDNHVLTYRMTHWNLYVKDYTYIYNGELEKNRLFGENIFISHFDKKLLILQYLLSIKYLLKFLPNNTLEILEFYTFLIMLENLQIRWIH